MCQDIVDIQNSFSDITNSFFWISRISILDIWKRWINVNSACHTCLTRHRPIVDWAYCMPRPEFLWLDYTEEYDRPLRAPVTKILRWQTENVRYSGCCGNSYKITILFRFGCDSTAVRLLFDCSSTALRPLCHLIAQTHRGIVTEAFRKIHRGCWTACKKLAGGNFTSPPVTVMGLMTLVNGRRTAVEAKSNRS